ncbi:MAG: alpha/beta hydrolase [Bacteroidales bacterium]|nr:alpha/beta hydrolase [Bacteroidales bacterium]MBN2758392.1 alpha/beta hydrolase [Bacteroidales bacterium]
MVKSLLEESTVTKRFLFPRKKHLDNPFFIKTKNDRLSCYRQFSHIDKKMLIVFHGSNEIVNDYIDVFAKKIDKMGYNLLVAEYRGYSYSSGFANLVNILDDIYYIIKDCGVAEEDIVVFGRSIGTIYAMHAIKLFPKIKGIIIESGIADFYDRIIKRLSPEDIETTEEQLKEEINKYFDIEKTIKSYKGSSLFMHTIDDRIIGVEHSKKLHEWANEPKTISLYAEGGHCDIQDMNQEMYFHDIKKLIDSLE